MARRLATREQIAGEMQRRIAKSTALDGDCRECTAPSIYLLQEPDEAGCNWSPNVYGGPAVCANVILEIVREVQAIYNLKA